MHEVLCTVWRVMSTQERVVTAVVLLNPVISFSFSPDALSFIFICFFFFTVSSSSHAVLRIRIDVESSVNVSYVITIYILEFLSIFTCFISM